MSAKVLCIGDVMLDVVTKIAVMPSEINYGSDTPAHISTHGGGAAGNVAAWLTRTALCIEARDPQRANGPKAETDMGGKSSHLYVFMPPLQRLEDYLDLLAAIEATAEGCPFAPRCEHAVSACSGAPAVLRSATPDHAHACARVHAGEI